MKTMNLKTMMSALIVTGLLMIGACSKDKSTDPRFVQNGGSGDDTRNVEVRMTDAPASYASLDLEVNAVEIYIDGKGWTKLSSKTKSFNVLSLNNGKYISLGHHTSFENGTYSKVRVYFGDRVDLKTYAVSDLGIMNFSATAEAQARWEGPKAIEIEIESQTEADAEGKVIILLDFDAAKSIIKDGKDHIVKPVIKCLKNTETGIQGKITGAASAFIHLEGENFSSSTTMDMNGEFKIQGVSEGNYNLRIEYYKNGHVSALPPESMVIEGIFIAEGEVKYAGEIKCK
jgi:hypothetical protein